MAIQNWRLKRVCGEGLEKQAKWGWREVAKGCEVARGRNLSQHENTEVYFDALSVSCPLMSLLLFNFFFMVSSLLFLF